MQMRTNIVHHQQNQWVSLPKSLHFSPNVQMVSIRQLGVERIISPAHQIWDSFFDDKETVSEDFQRGEQISSEREAF